MKINKHNPLQLLDNIAKTSPQKAKLDGQIQGQGGGATQDKVELSSWKQEVNLLKEKVKAIPLVREDLVAKAQEAIKTDPSQIYNGKGQLVARGLLRSQLLDEIL